MVKFSVIFDQLSQLLIHIQHLQFCPTSKLELIEVSLQLLDGRRASVGRYDVFFWNRTVAITWLYFFGIYGQKKNKDQDIPCENLIRQKRKLQTFIGQATYATPLIEIILLNAKLHKECC